MPRRARIAVPGIPWHIIQRGNNRSACFYAEEDYVNYLNALSEQAKKYHCAIHAYVVMTNHVHLLITPEHKNSAALLMKHLGQRYVQYINRTYRRSGTLWEGRFKSCLAQDEAYVLTCYRYIELNPVWANIVRHPRGYRWSSYPRNADGVQNKVLTPQTEYLRLGSTAQNRQGAYRALFAAHLDPEDVKAIRNATNGNYVLGDSRFQAEIAEMLKRRVVPGLGGRPPKSGLDDKAE